MTEWNTELRSIEEGDWKNLCAFIGRLARRVDSLEAAERESKAERECLTKQADAEEASWVGTRDKPGYRERFNVMEKWIASRQLWEARILRWVLGIFGSVAVIAIVKVYEALAGK